MEENKVEAEATENNSPSSVAKAKKISPKLIVLLGVLVVGLAVLAVILINNANKPDFFEDYAVRNARTLMKMMKDPDSFEVTDDVPVLRAQVSDLPKEWYTYIPHKAQNSFGAYVHSTAIFIGNKYVGDLDENTLGELARAKALRSEWLVSGNDGEHIDESKLVNKNKVQKNL